MPIQQIYLRHFRNYSEASFELSPGVNSIVGPNARGKTSLIEALVLASTGKSFRTHQLNELILKGRDFFFLDTKFDQGHNVTLSFNGNVKQLQLGEAKYAHFSPLLGHFPTVVLVPEDIAILVGPPAERRRLLDMHLSQSNPDYIRHLTRYHKALRHRNFLLKQRNEDELSPWEQIMVAEALHIQGQRHHFVHTIHDHLAQIAHYISDQHDTIKIEYNPSRVEHYPTHRAKDLAIGTTTLGPHRDDITILINQMPAASYGSQGQLRGALAALKLAQWEHLRSIHTTPPLLCIDDFAAHLDAPRQEQLLSHLPSMGQVFITTTHMAPHGQTHLIKL